MKKKLHKVGKKPNSFSEKILKILSQNANKSFNYKQIAADLEVTDTKSRNEIILDLKADNKKIVAFKMKHYI